MKKSFFEKMGLVERVDGDCDSARNEAKAAMYAAQASEEEPEEEVQVNTDNVEAESMIGDAYYENNLEDISRSVYKVEEVLKTLPTTMPEDVSRQTVKGILASFGISVEDVDRDAKARAETIQAVRNKMCDKETDEIKRLEQEVEDLLKQAEEKKQEIQSHNLKLEAIVKTSKEELARIKKLWDFITEVQH